MSLDMLPLVSFDRIDNDLADHLLVKWGHWLGACNRPFGRQSFGLQLAGAGLISVAVSASTVNPMCGGYDRVEVVELARLASHPDHCRWVCRVMLRLWRETAPAIWGADYWSCKAAVSYQNAVRHTGNLYRFDGWERLGEVRGGTAGGNWTRGKRYDPKVVWGWKVTS
jgi:hypothetical protein